MQVLLAPMYYATGSYCLVIGDTLGVSEGASTRAVYSKALCAIGLLGRGLNCIIPNVGREGSFYKITSPDKTSLIQHRNDYLR